MKIYDKPTFPGNGIIYTGDYYQDIPYHLYISREELPAGPVFDIREYGATTEPGVLSTEAVQKALDDAGNSWGTVLVTGGAYTTGTLTIPSSTTLFIDSGSSINASKDLSQFQDAFIKTVESADVTICGGGRINGNGEFFVYLPHERPLTTPLGYTKLPPVLNDPMGRPEDTTRFKYRERIRYAEDKWNEGKPNIPRPMYTLWIRGSENVDIHNIIIRDSMDWSLSIDGSDNVKVENIVIDNNRHTANTDGIDIMSSCHVKVKHVFVSTADDGLCIKAPMTQGHDSINVENEKMAMGPSEDIEIEDATVISVMNAFKIGTETYFDIKGVTCRNCTFMLPDIFPAGVSGISIESADGSNISDIHLENITMKRISIPLSILHGVSDASTLVSAEVKGDSMIEANIFPGDYVFFAKGMIKGEGIYVIALAGDIMVKRLSFDALNRRLSIISENKNYPVLTVDADESGVRILGKVVGWIHNEVV